MSYRELKRRVEKMLLEGDTAGLSALAKEYPRTISALIGLSYDKESLVAWRAIEAVGSVVGEITRRSAGAGRNIVQRLLWSITEESGGIGWSAIEMLGEVVRNRPDDYSDLIPIIIGLFDEPIFRPGVLYAICRISERTSVPYDAVRDLLREALADEVPEVRGWALLTLKCLGKSPGMDLDAAVRDLMNDGSKIKVYRNGVLTECSVKSLAEELAGAC
ncbi:MAG: hypothetical protein GXO94_07265 [Nitrospirae bacterium]|nr:hypothetical protein [Nitrospirota bacterium]